MRELQIGEIISPETYERERTDKKFRVIDHRPCQKGELRLNLHSFEQRGALRVLREDIETTFRDDWIVEEVVLPKVGEFWRISDIEFEIINIKEAENRPTLYEALSHNDGSKGWFEYNEERWRFSRHADSIQEEETSTPEIIETIEI